MSLPTPTDLAAELEYRARFEDVVLAFSARLVSAEPGELDDVLREGLAAVARFLRCDRSFVFEAGDDPLRVTHEHCEPGVRSPRADFEHRPRAAVAWGIDRLESGMVLEVPSPDHLPADAAPLAALLTELGVGSSIVVPVAVRGRAVGGIVFEWLGRRGGWTPVTASLLRWVGQIVAGAVLRNADELRVRTAEERLRSFLEATEDSICCFEPDTELPLDTPMDEQIERMLDARLVVANHAYLEMRRSRGASSAPFGKTMRELAGPAALDSTRAVIRRTIERGYQSVDPAVEVPTADGGVRLFVARSHGVLANGRLLRLWGQLRDVTEQRRSEEERKALEAQLLQAQKMESIGLLAGGIAHDFNNLLVVISNYAQFALDELRLDLAASENGLRQVLKASDRAAELTRALLTFGRRQHIQRRPIDLNAAINGLLGMLRRIIREAVEIDFMPGHELGTVNVDAGQFEQMLINLCVNASDAIADVGRITIETENVRLNGAYIKAHPWARPGRYVLLTVTDTGMGMAPEVRERIFEPFFTTKEAGRGTGLGLAIVYGIVKQHDGMIHVYSEVGTGTTFKIYLPIVERAASSVGGKVESVARGGSETILVAEDHEMVREVVRAMLERAGYRVLVARDGGEARQIFDARGHEIDLVLLDAVMPVVPGQIVFDHFMRQRPDLPILVSSGYASGVFPPHFFAEKGVEIVPKPYDADDLMRRIREALDRRNAGRKL